MYVLYMAGRDGKVKHGWLLTDTCYTALAVSNSGQHRPWKNGIAVQISLTHRLYCIHTVLPPNSGHEY
jgi:hypothetical protein